MLHNADLKKNIPPITGNGRHRRSSQQSAPKVNAAVGTEGQAAACTEGQAAVGTEGQTAE